MTRITAAFPKGKHKVLTLSYDDGKTADRRLIGLLNTYGLKGTFHLNAGLFHDEERISKQEAAALYNGHEISAHTYTHPTIARSPREQLVFEITEDRKVLESITGYPVRGMSYPNGSYTREIQHMLPFLGIEYARTVHSTSTFAMPDNWHEWNPTCHHNHDLIAKTRDFLALKKEQYLYMMYVWGHSYEFDHDDNWAMFESFCELAGGHDDIWYATNIEIVRYMKAFERLQFAADSSFVWNPSAISVWLIADGEKVEVPGGERVRFT